MTEEIIEAMKPAYVAGFTLLGGEPFEPENQRLIDLNKTRESGEVVLWG